MKFLIVNGFNATYQGIRSFEEFSYHVQLTIKKEVQKVLEEIEFIKCDRNELSKYLYEFAKTHQESIECIRAFDSIDIVYISGEINLMPWMPKALQMLTLIKMCLKVNKPLFAAGFAMQALVFLTATDIEKPIKIVNGAGYGSPTSELKNLKINPAELQFDDKFLDHITGDLYKYSKEYGSLIPVGNTGLHLHNAAATSSSSLGKCIINSSASGRGKILSQKTDTCNHMMEVTCSINKYLLTHWAFIKCESLFPVPTKAKWEIHPFSFVNKKNIFKILAESAKAPLIIEMTNTIGIKFDIDKKYPNTIKILENFTKKIFNDLILDDSKVKLSLFQMEITKNYQRENTVSDNIPNKFIIKSPKKIFQKNVLKENSSRQDTNLNENNPSQIKLTNREIKLQSPSKTNLNSHSPKTTKDRTPLTLESKSSERNLFFTTNSTKNELSPIMLPNKSDGSNSAMTSPKFNGKIMLNFNKFFNPNRINNIERIRTVPDEDRFLPSPNPQSYSQNLKSPSIRSQLYPNLEVELAHPKDVWVPGNYSLNKRELESKMEIKYPKGDINALNREYLQENKIDNKKNILKSVINTENQAADEVIKIRIPYKISINASNNMRNSNSVRAFSLTTIEDSFSQSNKSMRMNKQKTLKIRPEIYDQFRGKS